ncbi:MAG: RagB/SusD family nutrient uptake outer membrane protein [Bacteroidales bacterium]|nr:RagB/SusD family nutrient uptake outer membrane protein [Bacteroidales bacterium]
MKIKNYPAICGMILSLAVAMAACTDYLDKAPESDISEKEVFGNFISYQGWVEEMAICMSNYHQILSGNLYYTFNITEIMQDVPVLWDDGNYWNYSFLGAGSSYLELGTTWGTMSKFAWPLAWYAIRKANTGLQNLELMQGTQEEKDLLKGQCLYYRAFYHLELMQFFGGLPYIDRALAVEDSLTIPRLSYAETAKRVAEDFSAAAELLPLNWANTYTLAAGTNRGRPTKVSALAYKGKNLLYAASPMMNESSTGVNAYDPELCRQAAEAFDEVIRLCEQAGSAFYLETWANWPSIFVKVSASGEDLPGGAEVLQHQTIYENWYVNFTTQRAQLPVQFGSGNTRVESPTHNFIKYYHMANGLPIDDPASGYDPNDPWTNREPRFYNDIVYEGARMLNTATGSWAQYEFAHLHNNGEFRHGTNANYRGSVTGYLDRRYVPVGAGTADGIAYQAYEPRLRLADVYLMYAEAVFHGYGSANDRYPGANYTAQEAIEKIRERAQLQPLPAQYYAAGNFMETLIRERAVEMAFEGLRWFDLRRWNIAGEEKYRQKTGVNFDIDADGKPVNIRETLLTTRVFEKKHNWLPFPVKDTKIYPGWYQNPGW